MKTLSFAILGAIAVSSAALHGCGGDGGGGSGGSGGSGSSSTTGSMSTSSASTGEGGATGGCSAAAPCSPIEFCDFADDQCGANGKLGVCKPRPNGCEKNYVPACGCDGIVYGKACTASSKGVDASNNGGCPAPAGTFACGPGFCAKNQQYCRVDKSDVGSIPDGYGCMSLPADCFQGAPPSCACLANETCGANCAATPDNDLTLTCPGG